jgi:hypothetical protein
LVCKPAKQNVAGGVGLETKLATVQVGPKIALAIVNTCPRPDFDVVIHDYFDAVIHDSWLLG